MAYTMAASLIKPDYMTRFYDSSSQARVEDTVGPLPAIKLAIPRTVSFQTPKNGLPVNPSPHTGVVDPAIQMPAGGRISPSFFEQHQSPRVEQRGVLSPRDTSPQKTFNSPRNMATQTDDFALPRSSSQTSLDGCHYCRGCQQRIQHRRSNTDSSITSSTTSASPNVSSPETGEVPKRLSSSFGRKFKFNVLQRSNTRETRGVKNLQDRDEDVKKARKKSVTKSLMAKKPTKKIAIEMVGERHWADDD
jgi:hypothetical protein